MSEFENEFESLSEFVFLCLNFEDFVMSHLKVLWFCDLGKSVQISSLIHSIST